MVVRLPPPARPLRGGEISLRLPSPNDLEALALHTATATALAGTWLPIEPRASRDRLAWLVGDWSRAWAGDDSHNGRALLLDVDGVSLFVGHVGFGVRDDGAVELVPGAMP